MRSEKAGRGPLTKDWKETSDPVMCCYKLVEVEFKWFGLQGTVESRVQKVLHMIVSMHDACIVYIPLGNEGTSLIRTHH